MNSLMSMYFGPLDKKWCVYFLILSFLFFISLIVIILTEIYFIIMNFKKLNFKMVSSGIVILFNVFLSYFVNRLFYNMCNGTVR